MSAWRVAVQELHAAGYPMRAGQFMQASKSGLQEAKRYGLVTCDGTGCWAVWRITELGRNAAEGRTTIKRGRNVGRRWVATWLRALPQGLRMTA